MASADSFRSVLSNVTTDVLVTPVRPSPSRSSSAGGPSATTTTTTTTAPVVNGSPANRALAPTAPPAAASVLTLEAALAGAGGDHAAALDAALAERNMLSSQNAQLWKLIEKQRASYANAVKDLERIRGERDKALVRLDRDRKHRKEASHRDTPQKHNVPLAESPAAEFAINGGDISARSSPQHSDEAASVVDGPSQPPPAIITTLSPASPHSQTRHGSADTPSDATRPLQIGRKQHSLDSGLRSSPVQVTPPAGPPPVPPTTSMSVSNLLTPMDQGKRSKRESRVSIPPEARTFMQAMDDGTALPSPSPIILPNHQLQQQQQPHVNGTHRKDSQQAILSSVAEDPDSANRRQFPVSPGTPPFLDMKDDDDDDDNDDDDDSGPDAPVAASAPTQIPLSFQEQQQYAQGRATPDSVILGYSVEDNVQPTPTNHSASPTDAQSLQRPRQMYDLNSTPPNTPPVHQVNAGSSSSSSATTAGTFRALRLTHPDIAGTTLSVVGSQIRANDRGKEVLSFVIGIMPPSNGRSSSGTGPYKIEKLYSDVVALDTRVRGLMSKSALKALVQLPDPKLFKDNAPAKVDQRKSALEKYLGTLLHVSAKLRSSDDLCAFLSSDIVRLDAKAPVMQSGHKEGYLTKRGKNFGGWKTRYFVLQNAILEYYESRGGTHLGSIIINGAQIGRQQRPQGRENNDDDNDFRHAFLIIEAKRGPGGQSPRHVLCAESDIERDSWVDVLVRYVTGEYAEPTGTPPAAQSTTSLASSVGTNSGMAAGRPSYENTSVKRPRMSKDDINVSKSTAVPISQLAADEHHAKLFQAAPIPVAIDTRAGGATNSPVGSPDKSPANTLNQDPTARRVMEGQRQGQQPHMYDAPPPPQQQQQQQISLSTSVPSYLDVGHPHAPSQRPSPQTGTPRSASELGHYPDLKGPPQSHPLAQGQGQGDRPAGQSTRQIHRNSYHPSLSPAQEVAEHQRPPQPRHNSNESPDMLTPRATEQSLTAAPAPPRTTKISGPMNGAPIPAGYNFGGNATGGVASSQGLAPSQTPSASSSSNNLSVASTDKDRRGKGVSRFWGGFSRDKGPAANDKPLQAARAVIGVPLDESLNVAEIAMLPAIVFRCIQYLEAKRADQEEGIYRLSGSSAVVKQLRERFNAEVLGPPCYCGLLKSFLRELPASILTRELHLQFLHVIDFADPQERISELQSLIAKLPIANYSLLRALTAHLILIVQNSGVNKMPMRNVGIVFSPTLGIPAGVFSLMLAEFNRVFSVDQGQQASNSEDDPNTPVDPAAAAVHLARRNSRHYADASADQMLGLSGRSLPTDADDSDDGEDLSVHEESGADTEGEGDNTLSSDAPSQHSHSQHSHYDPSFQQQQQYNAYHQQGHHDHSHHHGEHHGEHHQSRAHSNKAAGTAAQRGLQVNVVEVAAARRTSHLPNGPGLPSSPRPAGRSSSSGPLTPTLATTQR
ncbi:RhoGAP-domain-containing protein [Auriculariales sp. MPI-PUGE-AT-0066]|nr:RhoGAP-domain-containing protein [Auriculariales sp. MPI-PUGE-AT-0066]